MANNPSLSGFSIQNKYDFKVKLPFELAHYISHIKHLPYQATLTLLRNDKK